MVGGVKCFVHQMILCIGDVVNVIPDILVTND